MRIVEPSAWLFDISSRAEGIELLRRIETIGRVSHRSEEKQTADSWERFIETWVLHHGDWSITQHVLITVAVECDRGVSHEWVRHRIGAYTQESTRFVNYGKNSNLLRYIAPPEDEVPTEEAAAHWTRATMIEEQLYLDSLKLGFKPEIARDHLPHATATKLIVSYAPNIWRYFFLMRTSKQTHPKMRAITIPLLQHFKDRIPLLFDDIEPGQRQIDNLRMPH